MATATESMATAARSTQALLPPCLLVIVLLLQPVGARPLVAPAACAGTGVQPVALSKPLDFCGGQIGESTCCDGAKDSTLRLAFVHAFSNSSSKQHTHDHDHGDASSCAAALLKRRLCAVCFPAARIPADTTLPAPCAALAAALPSSSTGHLSRSSAPASPSNSICFEKVAAASYSGLIVAPDGSGRALMWNQQGEVWLASMPVAEETGAAMQVGDSPFIDLSGLARYDEARGLRGLLGMASHPLMDGRFFISYTTIKSNDNDCGLAAGSCPLLVVSELSPREGGFEVATVFSMGLPAAQAGISLLDHGGQIFFRPNDPSLYLVTGHGTSADFVSSNKSSLLGKILRLHVDHDMPGTDAEVFFSSLKISRGCALDYSGSLYCASIDETQRERVHLISSNNLSSATSVVVLDLESPAAGMASAAIVWGLQYQGSADASLSGRFIYAYNFALWSAVEWPPSSGHYTPTRMLVACSMTSPIPCQDGTTIVSFAEDQNKEGFVLATDGVYKIVASSLCTGGGDPLLPAPAPASHSSSGAVLGSVLGVMGTALIFAIWICMKLLQEDGRDVPCLSLECFRDCSCKDNTCICCLC